MRRSSASPSSTRLRTRGDDGTARATRRDQARARLGKHRHAEAAPEVQPALDTALRRVPRSLASARCPPTARSSPCASAGARPKRHSSVRNSGSAEYAHGQLGSVKWMTSTAGVLAHAPHPASSRTPRSHLTARLPSAHAEAACHLRPRGARPVRCSRDRRSPRAARRSSSRAIAPRTCSARSTRRAWTAPDSATSRAIRPPTPTRR